MMIAVIDNELMSNKPSTWIFRQATGKPGELIVTMTMLINDRMVRIPTTLKP